MFHNFLLINHKTGNRQSIEIPAATPSDAEKTIREHNFAGFTKAEWAVRELRYIRPGAKECGCYEADGVDVYCADCRLSVCDEREAWELIV